MDWDHLELAARFIVDLSKQMMTLATGVFALTVTFLKSKHNGASRYQKYLKASWLLYLISIVFGIMTLMAMSGSLANFSTLRERCDPVCIEVREKAEEKGQNPDEVQCDESIPFNPYCSAKRPAGGQILTFLAASFLVVFYGSKVLSTSKNEKKRSANLVDLTIATQPNAEDGSTSLKGSFEVVVVDPIASDTEPKLASEPRDAGHKKGDAQSAEDPG